MSSSLRKVTSGEFYENRVINAVIKLINAFSFKMTLESVVYVTPFMSYDSLETMTQSSEI